MTLSWHDFLRRAFSGVILVIWIIAPYSLLQQFAIRDVYWLEPSAFDNSIAINFHSLWFYYTFYLLLGVVGLTVNKPVSLRYFYTIGWTTMVAHMVFFFFPNGVTREQIPLDEAPYFYKLLHAFDEPRNAFPSLHAALSVVAGIAATCCYRYHWIFKCLIWLWVLGIFWSTIALRQHVLNDLLAGTIIAVLAWFFVGRFHRNEIDQMRDSLDQ